MERNLQTSELRHWNRARKRLTKEESEACSWLPFYSLVGFANWRLDFSQLSFGPFCACSVAALLMHQKWARKLDCSRLMINHFTPENRSRILDVTLSLTYRSHGYLSHANFCIKRRNSRTENDTTFLLWQQNSPEATAHPLFSYKNNSLLSTINAWNLFLNSLLQNDSSGLHEALISSLNRK